MTATSFATARFVAIDLGASSGRVIVGTVGSESIDLEEVHRFTNEPVQRSTGLHWNFDWIVEQVLIGLTRAADIGEVAGIGIDSWAIDYGLIDATGTLVNEPFCYRDARTLNTDLLLNLARTRAYQLNGLQHLPFTTLYQLATEAPTKLVGNSLLLIPDLLTCVLTGIRGTEIANASTTGLLETISKRWSAEIQELLRLPQSLLGPLRMPGDIVGPLLPHHCETTRIPTTTPVIAVGSHDTASAIVSIPAEDDQFAYISCGTWGLVGVELDQPILTEESRLANFTNELGVDGTVRYLRNVMGLWLLQECMRTWKQYGRNVELQQLLQEAGSLPQGETFDVDDPQFIPPGDMPMRIASACANLGVPAPTSEPEIVRYILDSLAAAFARTISQASELSGKMVTKVHLVGGGSQNELLCQLTANACGLPVVAGPVEATAIGNILVQARAVGTIAGTLTDLRNLVRKTQTLRTYYPAD
jgi:rhamnulokinase